MNQGNQGIGMTSQRTRNRLVERLREEGITDSRILDVLRQVPRHMFMDEAMASRAYEDTALPIGHGQTISQPFIVARMTEVLFIEILRHHVASMAAGETGWLAALTDRQMAQALACFHRRPDHAWTLNEVARSAGTSRTGLIDSFRRVLGVSPMHYLTQWRLQLAVRALRDSRQSTSQIAANVGYGSEAALSRAFKRETGLAPSEWRSSWKTEGQERRDLGRRA